MSGTALWYLTRGTGVVALLLLTGGLVLGILSTDRRQRRRRPRFVVSGLHRSVALLSVAFVGAHVVTTLADSYAPIRVVDLFVPFVSAYRPVWLGLGAVALDLVAAIVVTSLLRARLGLRAWRIVHWLSYVSWPIALVHSLGTGSDARSAWFALLALACVAAVAGVVVWRIVDSRGALRIRLGAGVASVAVPVLLGAWYIGGPLQAGWARRAGTPTALLGTAVSGRGAGVVVPASFASTLSGNISEQQGSDGLVTVRIAAAARGSVAGVLQVQLSGEPVDEGVHMLASSVEFAPSGSSTYAGHIVQLNGTRLVASVADSTGRSLVLSIALQIGQSGQVAGVLRGSENA